LDCFCGSGTTTAANRPVRRHGGAYEDSTDFARFSVSIISRSWKMHEDCERCFVCAATWNTVGRVANARTRNRRLPRMSDHVARRRVLLAAEDRERVEFRPLFQTPA